MKTFFQSNTIRLALAAILGTWAAYFGGEMGVKESVIATVSAVGLIFLRKGANVGITKKKA